MRSVTESTVALLCRKGASLREKEEEEVVKRLDSEALREGLREAAHLSEMLNC